MCNTKFKILDNIRKVKTKLINKMCLLITLVFADFHRAVIGRRSSLGPHRGRLHGHIADCGADWENAPHQINRD